MRYKEGKHHIYLDLDKNDEACVQFSRKTPWELPLSTKLLSHAQPTTSYTNFSSQVQLATFIQYNFKRTNIYLFYNVDQKLDNNHTNLLFSDYSHDTKKNWSLYERYKSRVGVKENEFFFIVLVFFVKLNMNKISLCDWSLNFYLGLGGERFLLNFIILGNAFIYICIKLYDIDA